MKVVVTGGGGFIGGHLVKALVADGHDVRSVDVKPIEEVAPRTNNVFARSISSPT